VVPCPKDYHTTVAELETRRTEDHHRDLLKSTLTDEARPKQHGDTVLWFHLFFQIRPLVGTQHGDTKTLSVLWFHLFF
jgi:DNA repair exonuclease SbcCD nuclease subunit